METQNKQWVCHPVLDHSGQLGPEDLSSNNRGLQSRLTDDDNKPIINNEQQLSDIQNKNGLDQFFVQQVEDAIWLVNLINFYYETKEFICDLFHLFETNDNL